MKRSEKRLRLFPTTVAAETPRYIDSIKNGIWIYFFLLIFEGALRKWVLPGLASPLLVVRDPFALFIIVIAIRHKLLVLNGYMLVVAAIAFVSFILAMTAGHGNLIVALYGTRVLLIHFPLVFLIGKVFTWKDAEKMGVVLLWISIPMIILVTLQFYSPQSAWVNRGVGGDERGAGFSGALGFFRPPATFSFTNGNSLFFSLVAAYVFYFWLTPGRISKLILICGTGALIMAVPFSISRSLFFQVALTAIFSMFIIIRKPKYLGAALVSVLVLASSFVLLSQTSFLSTALEAFSHRFDLANDHEGGVQAVIVDRYLGGLISSFEQVNVRPFFGIGIGAGSNVGSQLMTGETHFLAGEGEWGRLIAEIGPIMGCLIILIRLMLSAEIFYTSYQRLTAGKILPWLLFSFAITTLPQGGWAQPTSLGFCVISGGLVLSALNETASFRKNYRFANALAKRVQPVVPPLTKQ